MASVVYFIQSVIGGPVKIGHSVWPTKRLAALQCASPHRLRIVATMPGARGDERHFQHRFDVERMSGEWFEPSQRICEFIASIGGRVAEMGGTEAEPKDPPIDQKLYAARIARLRAANGWSIKDLARILGHERRFVRLMELRGSTLTPTKLAKLGRALSIPPTTVMEYLLGKLDLPAVPISPP
jgi:Meiotically up-regulated gene 113